RPDREQAVTPTLLALITFTALTAEPEVEVRPLAGESVTGRLTELSAKKAAVDTASGSREFECSKLMWIQVPGIAPAEKPTIWIDLLDGSKVAATSFVAAEGAARITVAGRPPLEIPTRSIHAVRF